PSGDPGTLSRPVLTSLLREQMKFEGLIFTDAMDMRGILVQYGPDTAAMRAVEAGADVLLMPLDVGRTIDAVVRGVTEGRYTEERLDRSVRRILASKERLRLHRSRTVDLDSARLMVGDSAHAALARSAAVRSITLVKDSLRLLPLGSRPSNSRVLSITFARRADLSAGQAFNAELRRVFRGVREEYVDADGGGPNYQRLLRVADSADVVIVSPYVGHSWDVATVAAPAAFAEFVRALVRGGRSPIVMAMGNPYFLQQVPEVSTYVVAWGGFPVSQQAAAWALLGTNAITGRLPIAIPPVAPLGAGETRAQLAAGASSSTRSRQ
ncbi:MAG TPA: glycoside hydrolase family 3 N-terminal domain-containing protein, partial [Gemmatimonadaceae bacterium]|nr:glycoside hydrolase family 3 N-terminal domain-containing protein [Gemmatimonadaceae bacterium]